MDFADVPERAELRATRRMLVVDFGFLLRLWRGGRHSLSMHLNSNAGKGSGGGCRGGYLNTHLTRLREEKSHPEVCSSKSRHFFQIDLDL